MAADYRHIGGLENRLGRHYSRFFRRFRPPQPLPINHLLSENRGTQGRIGEVRLTHRRRGSAALRPVHRDNAMASIPSSHSDHVDNDRKFSLTTKFLTSCLWASPSQARRNTKPHVPAGAYKPDDSGGARGAGVIPPRRASGACTGRRTSAAGQYKMNERR